MERTKKIIRTSILGIAVNLVLVLFKMAVGLIANSIAIVLDAVNNLSDALSSVITIVGTKLAGRRPDKKHPYGHGRIEYLTSVLIAVIVILAGVTSLRESIEKIIHPETATYSAASLIIIAVAVVVKVLMGRYVKHVGKSINSQSLVASGSDALFDAILSLATLAAAVVSLLWGIGLEGILGALISLFILKAGIEMLMEPLHSIIGVRADSELTEGIRAKVESFDQVRGAYDLTLHNYGPNLTIGSIHIEVADDMPAREIHKLTRHIAMEVLREYGVILTVGIYAANDSSPLFTEMRATAEGIAAANPDILQLHGFYAEEETKIVMFDLIVDFKADAEQIRQQVKEQMEARWPDYCFDIILDSDYSD